jgi:hypothetical protein
VAGGNIFEIAIGFLGRLGINTLLWIRVLSGESETIIMDRFRPVPLYVNVPALLVLGFTRRYDRHNTACNSPDVSTYS